MQTNGRPARAESRWIGSREHLLADAGLAQDQHVDVAGRRALGQPLHALHALLGADDRADPVAAGGGVGSGRILRAARAHAGAGEQGGGVSAVFRVTGNADPGCVSRAA